jgi:uncharacterized protein GlcG (DUF336 family)
LAKGKELDLKPLSVVVLDAGGHVIAFEREDGAAPGRFAIAQAKAFGSIMLGMGGTAQMARAGAAGLFYDCGEWPLWWQSDPSPLGVFCCATKKAA